MPSTLEQTIPVYHFHERHSRWIDTSPAKAWEALNTLTLEQPTVARPLVAIRHLGRTTSPAKPLLSDGPLQMLEMDAPTYAVGGAIARPWQRRPDRRDISTVSEFARFDEPGWTKYLADFRIESRDGGVQLITETRGYSTDDWARRRFTLYWTLIRPASGLIRRDMLATIERRATRSPVG
ncbi:MAG: hypothetical protein M0Z87_09690 [Actinomycetota bacterium]|nr:hypothetical protein [Actinomycetota bacterium]